MNVIVEIAGVAGVGKSSVLEKIGKENSVQIKSITLKSKKERFFLLIKTVFSLKMVLFLKLLLFQNLKYKQFKKLFLLWVYNQMILEKKKEESVYIEQGIGLVLFFVFKYFNYPYKNAKKILKISKHPDFFIYLGTSSENIQKRRLARLEKKHSLCLEEIKKEISLFEEVANIINESLENSLILKNTDIQNTSEIIKGRLNYLKQTF